MESIDRLRRYVECHDKITGLTATCINHLIDSIEEEVEGMRDFCERLDDAATKREDVTLWGVDYTALPLDAEGVPIRVGDVMEWDNGTFTVHELKVTEDGWTTWDEQHGYTVHVDVCHHHAPTVEDVLREFAAKVEPSWRVTELPNATLAEYAAKLRLAEEVDDAS